MKKISLVLILFPALLFSQLDKSIENGFLINALNETVKFKKLRWEKDKAIYTNSESNQVETLYETSIKSIEKIEETLDEKEKNDKKTGILDGVGLEASPFKTLLPDGVYLKKEDFISGTPSKTTKTTPKGLYGLTKPIVEDGSSYCFFYDENDKKIINGFAIVHKGFLYFRMSEVLKNKNKNDKALSTENINAFTKVYFGNEQYLYTEAKLGNPWEKGLNANLGLPTSMADSLKPIIWDSQNSEFNIIKNCGDFNEFIKEKLPSDVITCSDKKVDINIVRLAIQKLALKK